MQNAYGVGAPSEERELLRACGELGIAFVPFFAIAGSGREAGVRTEVGEGGTAVQEVARAHGASAAQVRLAWTLQQGPHVLAIPGTGDPEHLAENVAAGALRLTEKETARLGADPGVDTGPLLPARMRGTTDDR